MLHLICCQSKCIFLGYNAKQKGYFCLDPHINCVYISRRVVFDELNLDDSSLLARSAEVVPPSVDVEDCLLKLSKKELSTNLFVSVISNYHANNKLLS